MFEVMINGNSNSYHKIRFLIKQARKGDAEAQFKVGKFLIKQGKLKRAICFLEHASLRGNLEAEKFLHCLTNRACNHDPCN